MDRVPKRPVRHRIDREMLGQGSPARVLWLLRELQVEQDRISRTYADTIGLHTTDLRAGDLISQHWERPLTMGELAELLGLSSGAVTGTVDRLAEAGYVERIPDEDDRRRMRLHLTPKAEAVGLRFYAEHLSPMRAAVESFDATELATVERFLATVVTALADDLEDSALHQALEEVGARER